MLKTKSQRISFAGLFTALGLILPFATSHTFGVPGTILLPMHIPVLLGGLICGPKLGAICGLIIPVLSSVLTGMPAAYPMLPIMAIQLFAMGVLTGLLHEKLNLHVYISLIVSMLAGWVMYGLTYAALMFAGNGQLQVLSVTAAVVKGLPGIGIQLILIPVVVTALKKTFGHPAKMAAAPAAENLDAQSTVFTKAVSLISAEEYSCILIKDGVIAHTADGRGVSPLMRLWDSEPSMLEGAFVVDKIIGKAAAMILVAAGAKRVYGEVMSTSGEAYLNTHGIETSYGIRVELILNRTQTGICPIEQSVIGISDPHEGIASIKHTVAALMSAG